MRTGFGCLLLLFSWPVLAQEGGFWRLDPLASQAQFQVNLRLPIAAEGRFTRVEGDVQRLPDQKLSVRVQLDTRGLVMGGPSWIHKVTHSPQFLDSAKYPEIRFQSTPFTTQLLLSGGDISGQLAIREISKPAHFRVLPSACPQPGRACPIMASGRINRHDFGMDAYRWSLRDEVVVAFQLKFADE